MSEHKRGKISGSSAKRAIHCPGSVNLSARFPDKESEYAERGTKLHSVMETWIELWTQLSGLPKQIEHEIAKRMAQLDVPGHEFHGALKPAWDATLELFGARVLAEEVQCEVVVAIDGMEGESRVDLVHYREGVLTVADYKFGQNVKVTAEENYQLMFYALGAIDTLGIDVGELDRIRLAIIQPAVHGLDVWETDMDFMKKFRELLANTVRRVEQKPPIYQTGPWCQFCRAKPGCPAMMSMAQHVEFMPLKYMTATELSWALERIAHIKEWVVAVEELAKAELQRGATIPGFKLGKGRKGKWAWNDPVDAVAEMKNRGYPLEYTERKVLTPAQFRKKYQSVDISDVAHQTETGPKIIPHDGTLEDNTALLSEALGKNK